jgi:hypothetical protein
MSEWWTYRPADLLMFSAQTYYRLLELYNRAVWPLHLAAAACGAALLACVVRDGPAAGRLAAALLALCWLWVGWAFHLERYATINLAGGYLAAGFAAQAALLLWSAVRARLVLAPLRGHAVRVGHVVLLLALAGYPLLAVAGGRPWRQMEAFGLAPDPTAVATLGVLLLAESAPWWLWPLPLLWCAVGSATLALLHAPLAWVPAALALLVIAAQAHHVWHRRAGVR